MKALTEFLLRYTECCPSVLVTRRMQSAPVLLRIEIRSGTALYLNVYNGRQMVYHTYQLHDIYLTK